MAVRRAYRVTFIARYREGAAGQARSLFIGLHELGHVVQEINVGRRPGLLRNPWRRSGGHGPVLVRLDRIAAEIAAFRPDVIFLVGDGLTFTRREMAALQEHCAVVAFTLADPAVFATVSRYAGMFTLHVTPSLAAARRYQEAGCRNTLYMPYGVDSRFFVPRPVHPQFRAQVAIIGHATPRRMEMARVLAGHFDLRLHGSGWPFCTTGPVRGDHWFRAAWSTKMLVHIPRSHDGLMSPGPGVFEGAAAGRLVLTVYLDELRSHFNYGEEIIGFEDVEDLTAKIRYFLERPGEAAAVAEAGRRRAARDHTWAQRLDYLFARLEGAGEQGRSWPSLDSGPALRLSRRPALPAGAPALSEQAAPPVAADPVEPAPVDAVAGGLSQDEGSRAKGRRRPRSRRGRRAKPASRAASRRGPGRNPSPPGRSRPG